MKHTHTEKIFNLYIIYFDWTKLKFWISCHYIAIIIIMLILLGEAKRLRLWFCFLTFKRSMQFFSFSLNSSHTCICMCSLHCVCLWGNRTWILLPALLLLCYYSAILIFSPFYACMNEFMRKLIWILWFFLLLLL